ncbi:carboxymuconolactone decarboxylase family protein [Flavobacterium alkalisoli]|uniref:Carboxymuconolactone decarboxylase family protein n=1 Tax=Flavobacterium alkalisoli TaxID=2602769 RepID=A0A5B9FUB7_9FLAO|nr:carboxymuconolactone decarboxylase family protein [Flavobacterium alkalisoli]QEE48312.1 carboxymuconolactone decarboxylase family protein [Flavobacterium alkalisoli]
MKTRMKLLEVVPEAYKAMFGLEKYINGTELSKTHKHLIKIRASQINGCAFCINMHTEEARKDGETEKRIYTLNAWWDTNYFTSEERALLALTEEVTRITGKVSDETYENAVNLLGEKYVANAIIAIMAINAWNRMSVTTHMMPE